MATGGVVDLATKLGIRAGASVLVLDAPADFALELPPGVIVSRNERGPVDVAIVFATRITSLERRLASLAELVRPDGGLWVAWPKRASRVDTDLTDHAVRSRALTLGLVDNKVCAVDATWTALRLVWRVENRRS